MQEETQRAQWPPCWKGSKQACSLMGLKLLLLKVYACFTVVKCKGHCVERVITRSADELPRQQAEVCLSASSCATFSPAFGAFSSKLNTILEN